MQTEASPHDKMKADPKAALFELERMAALVSDYASRLSVIERAVRGRDLKVILDREQRQFGERAKVFVCDLENEVFRSNEEAAQLNAISGEAWDTADWLRHIKKALEGHLNPNSA